jgi:hypothetical protein
MTTRRLMIWVVVVAVVLWLAPYAVRAPAHWRTCRYMTGLHAERETVSLRGLAETEAYLRSSESEGAFWGVISQRVPQYRRQAEYHSRMRRRWSLVGYQPWKSLRAELADDVAQHPPDAIWRTIRYGFPPGLSDPDY